MPLSDQTDLLLPKKPTMQLTAVFAVALALCFATSSAEEDKKTRIMNFHRCIACSGVKAPEVKEEYVKCTALRPAKCQQIIDDCKAEHLPGLNTYEERWEKLCEDQEGIVEKMYECIMNSEARKEMTAEDKTQLKEYIQCAKKLDKKYCANFHQSE